MLGFLLGTQLVSHEDTKHFIRITRNFLHDHGLEHNANAIQEKLQSSGYPDVPSIRTINQVLKEIKSNDNPLKT